MPFSSEVELSITIPERELRSARSQIEDGLGSASVGMSGGGTAASATGGGRSQNRRMVRWARRRTSLMQTSTELLSQIHDTLEDAGGLIGGQMGGGGVGGGATTFVGRAAPTFTGASAGTILGRTSITSLISSAGVTLATFVGTVSLTTLVAGVGSILALIGGTVSLADVIDGDISSWNLPAKIGQAAGEGFQQAQPNIGSAIESAMTEGNPFFEAGQEMRRLFQNPPDVGQTEVQRPGSQPTTGPFAPQDPGGGGDSVNINLGDFNLNLDVDPSEAVDRAEEEAKSLVEDGIDDLERRFEGQLGGRP